MRLPRIAVALLVALSLIFVATVLFFRAPLGVDSEAVSSVGPVSSAGADTQVPRELRRNWERGDPSAVSRLLPGDVPKEVAPSVDTTPSVETDARFSRDLRRSWVHEMKDSPSTLSRGRATAPSDAFPESPPALMLRGTPGGGVIAGEPEASTSALVTTLAIEPGFHESPFIVEVTYPTSILGNVRHVETNEGFQVALNSAGRLVLSSEPAPAPDSPVISELHPVPSPEALLCSRDREDRLLVGQLVFTVSDAVALQGFELPMDLALRTPDKTARGATACVSFVRFVSM